MSTEAPRRRLVEKFAERFSIDADKLLEILKATAFRQAVGDPPTHEQMAALLIVADQYNLNPFTREIYAYRDKSGAIVPVVSVDGWARIINEHQAFNGLTFKQPTKLVQVDAKAKPCPEWIEAVFRRKDRAESITVREYLDECYRPPIARNDGSLVIGPWQSHTKRMLRHKALIQGARVAFGFSGIYDEDEAQRIIEAQAAALPAPETTKSGTDKLRAALGVAKPQTLEGLAEIYAPVTIDQPPATDPVQS